MEKINPFDWYYQVCNVTVDGNKQTMTDFRLVSSPEKAERLVKSNSDIKARRYRCDKNHGMIDVEWYSPKHNAWL